MNPAYCNKCGTKLIPEFDGARRCIDCPSECDEANND